MSFFDRGRTYTNNNFDLSKLCDIQRIETIHKVGEEELPVPRGNQEYILFIKICYGLVVHCFTN